MDKLYSVKETLKVLKISRAKLYRLMKDGAIKATKLDGRTFFVKTELSRFIETLKQG